MKSRLAIVILTLDQRETTLRCLRGLDLLDSTDDEMHVVVLDNGSVDGTTDAVRRMFPMVRVHHSSTNLGVAGGRNAAARLAMELYEPDYLLFLDNDVEVTPSFVSELILPFRRGDLPQLGLTQAKLLRAGDRYVIDDAGGSDIRYWLGTSRPIGHGERDRGQYDKERPCIACGGATLVRSSLFSELGGFDLAFNPCGPEDLDFSLRLRRAGYTSLFVPRAVAYHVRSHTYRGENYSEGYGRLRALHWMRLLHRHAPMREKLGFYLLGIPLIAIRVLVREGRKGNLGALRGLIRGLVDDCHDRWRRG